MLWGVIKKNFFSFEKTLNKIKDEQKINECLEKVISQ